MFPARAGMNRNIGKLSRVTDNVPRPRGDEPDQESTFKDAGVMFPARAGMNR